MKLTTLSRLFNDSLIYGIGGILAKGVAFLTIPIYTHIFSTSEFGRIELISVISSFFSAILTMGLDSAQSMYFFKHKNDGRDIQSNIISAILQWRIIIGFILVIIVTITSPLINKYFFDEPVSHICFILAFTNVFFCQLLVQSTEVLRLLFKPWSYILITFSQTILGALFILLFVIYFDYNIKGYFLGLLMSSAIMAVVGWIFVRKYINFRKYHFDWWPKLLRFGAPLVPASLGLYFMSSLDRWFVQYFHGNEALGLYALGAKFSMLMSLAVEIFRKAWWPIAMDAMHGVDGPEVFRMISRLYLSLGIIVIILLTSISPWLVEFLAPTAYLDAWPIIGILGWQAMFYGYFLIAAAGLTKVEKTYLYPILMGCALFLGFVMNCILVPRFGIIGASLATAITYLVWILISIFVSERFWSIGLLNRIFFVQITLGVLTCSLLLLDKFEVIVKIISTTVSLSLLIRISLETETILLIKSKLLKPSKKNY